MVFCCGMFGDGTWGSSCSAVLNQLHLVTLAWIRRSYRSAAVLLSVVSAETNKKVYVKSEFYRLHQALVLLIRDDHPPSVPRSSATPPSVDLTYLAFYVQLCALRSHF